MKALIRRELVFLDTPYNSRNDVLHALIDKVKHLGFIEDVDKYMEGVLNREDEFPTSVGFKVAIPHCRSNTVNNPFIAYMRTSTLFRWDYKNEEDVDTIFLIGVPEETESNLHLKFLSAISRKLMNQDFRDSLYNAKNVEEAYVILDSINTMIGE